MRWHLFVGILWVGVAAGALPGPVHPTGQPLPTLRTAREAHDLTPTEALRRYPVHLRAVVTYYDPYIDPRHAALFLHDATRAIFAGLPSRPILPLHPGDVVDVQGVSGMGDYAPVVAQAQVKKVGEGQVPAHPIAASMTQLVSPMLDGEWVELEGVVRAVHLSAKNVTLNLATRGGPLTTITLREDNVDYNALVDARIRLHGNAAPVFNKKRQMVGVHLFFPSMRQLTVLERAPADPFLGPAIPISGLLQFAPGVEVPHRVHVQGRLTLRWPGRILCIQEGKDGLCMDTAQETPVKVGDLLDVIGFPTVSSFRATLQYGSYRVSTSPALPVQPVSMPASEAFRTEHDSELIQIEGQVVGQEHAGGDLTLLLQSGSFLIPATLPRNSFDPNYSAIKDQSVIRVIGVCRTGFDDDSPSGEGEIHPGSVQLLLHSAGDVKVLKVPSWWTPRNTLGVLALVALISLTASVWVVVLRRQVRKQTQALRRSEERLRHLSEHDALTNLPNRNLLNDRMAMALHRARRFNEPVGLLMLDLDRFKEVNDLHGHRTGDQLLCEIAHRIRDAVRKTDTVARIGGDEFIVLLPDLNDPGEAELIAEKVLNSVAAPIRVGGQSISVTISIGVCGYPEGGETMEELMEHVDSAMYAAKAHGRNACEVYRAVHGL